MTAQRLLLAVGLGLVFVGFVLLFLGSTPSTSAGGCFFWPFPIIFVCGTGTSGSTYIAVVLAAVTVVAVVVSTLFFWMRRVPED